MMQAFFTGLVLGIALIFSVGPVIFTIIKLRINYSVISAFYFIFGVWLSDALLIVAANLFGNFFTELIEYKTPIGIAGGFLLLAMGLYYAVFKKNYTKTELDNKVEIGNATHLRLFFTGFLINTLNPGVLAVWMGAAANTIGYKLDEIVVVFTTTMAIMIIADIFKIKLAGKIREKLNDRTIKLVNRVAGIIYIVFGIALIIGSVWAYYKGI